MKFNPAKEIGADFDALLHRFMAENTVRYEDFAKIWREMNFTCSMCGRIADHELRLVSNYMKIGTIQ